MRTFYYLAKFVRPNTGTTITKLYLDTNLERLVHSSKDFWRSLGADSWCADLIPLDRKTFERVMEKDEAPF